MAVDIVFVVIWFMVVAFVINSYAELYKSSKREVKRIDELRETIFESTRKVIDTERLSHKMIRSVGSQLPAGMESSEDRQKRLESEKYVRDERGF